MNLETFTNLAQERFDQCLNLMTGSKNVEYSRHGDKLHNFKRAGDMLGCTPEKALLLMLSKHLVSIIDIVDDLDSAIPPDYNMVKEKITDSVNYLVLLEGLIRERIEIAQDREETK